MKTPANANAPVPYDYQQRDIDAIMDTVSKAGSGYSFLYQLPTGGGKTVIFCEIARRYMERSGRSVAILTHRNELCRQTSRTLKAAGVENRIINSKTRSVRLGDRSCVVAMVETLHNRIEARDISVRDVGLVIIDEAHHNSFLKLLENFSDAVVLGVTATPFSSNLELPLNKTYRSLIVGESIGALIERGFLARPKPLSYHVDMSSLSIGTNGDFTAASSDALYSGSAMLGLLLDAYRTHSLNKKTLIFNAGITASKAVFEHFRASGHDIRHLDNETPEHDRKEILHWFKKTKNAILTSVSILTTGFDEPSVQTVILNRATTSLTLYHQMVGRGARRLARKKTFTVIDLGGNSDRFGFWQDPVDWEFVFDHPAEYAERLHQAAASADTVKTAIDAALRVRLSNSLDVTFDLPAAFVQAKEKGEAHKNVIRDAIRQHARLCVENAGSASEALALAELLLPDIRLRVKQYASLLEKSTSHYRDWLIEDYSRRLKGLLQRSFARTPAAS